MLDKIWAWALNKFKDYVVRNWKTALVGILGGILSRYVSDQNTRDAIMAATIAALGVVGGDAKSEPLATTRSPLLSAVPNEPPDVPPSAHNGP